MCTANQCCSMHAYMNVLCHMYMNVLVCTTLLEINCLKNPSAYIAICITHKKSQFPCSWRGQTKNTLPRWKQWSFKLLGLFLASFSISPIHERSALLTGTFVLLFFNVAGIRMEIFGSAVFFPCKSTAQSNVVLLWSIFVSSRYKFPPPETNVPVHRNVRCTGMFVNERSQNLLPDIFLKTRSTLF